MITVLKGFSTGDPVLTQVHAEEGRAFGLAGVAPRESTDRMANPSTADA